MDPWGTHSWTQPPMVPLQTLEQLWGELASPPPHAECLVLLFSPELGLELGVLLLARRVRHLGNCNITSW